MSEMVERVARAMAGARWAEFDEEHRNAALLLARTAIHAVREPTEGMILAGERAEIPEGDSPAYVSWRAMIDEALK